jgi:hypothetical protein
VEVGVGVAENGGLDLSTEGMGGTQRERSLIRELGSAQENGGDGGLEVTHSGGGCDAGTCNTSQNRTASSSSEGDGDRTVNQLDRLKRRHNRMSADLSAEVETHNGSSGRNQPGSWETAKNRVTRRRNCNGRNTRTGVLGGGGCSGGGESDRHCGGEEASERLKGCSVIK